MKWLRRCSGWVELSIAAGQVQSGIGGNMRLKLEWSGSIRNRWEHEAKSNEVIKKLDLKTTLPSGAGRRHCGQSLCKSIIFMRKM